MASPRSHPVRTKPSPKSSRKSTYSSAKQPPPTVQATVQVIVETPKNSRNKYKLDEHTRRFSLSKLLPEGMVFPYDFGFFPDTRGQDGDPLDVLVLCEEPTFPGCQVACRLIGVLKATQKDKDHTFRNDRLIAVAQASVLHASLTDLAQLEPAVLKQIEDFFTNYQKVRDIEFTVLAREGPAAAQTILAQATEHASGRASRKAPR
jgi:inorganic pyrophosphatase